MKPASIRKQMIDELENIPEDKLQLLLELIRSSKSDLSDLQPKRRSITDYAGSWKEIDSDQYNTMIKELRDRREKSRRERNVWLSTCGYRHTFHVLPRPFSSSIQNGRIFTDHEKVYLSLITYYEILSGLRHIEATRQIEQFLEFCLFNEVLPITLKSASIAATHYAYIRRLGTPLDDMDLLIAGIAIENDMTLVTHNMKHFSRIPGLKLQDWIE